MSFIQLVKVKEDPEIKKEVIRNEGKDTPLLECYTEKVEPLIGPTCKGDIGKVTVIEVDTLTIVGMRIFTDKTKVYQDQNGDVWLDEDRYEDVFC